MRLTNALLLCLCGCAGVPGFHDPRISLAPQYFVLEVSGDTAMQSSNGGTLTSNPSQSLANFGMGSSDDDIGGMVRFGDGFSGIELGYLRLDNFDTRTGQLTQNWGNLVAGDVVNSRLEGDELRLRYIAEVIGHESTQSVGFGLGFGSTVAYRDFTFRAQEQTGTRSQNVTLHSDATLYIAARASIDYRGFALTGDYGISPDLTFGGDFEGDLHDVEVTGSYRFADQDVTLFASYRWSRLPAEGTEGAFAWEMDLRLQGYVLGVEVAF